MTPEQERQFNELMTEVRDLKAALMNRAEIDPLFAKTIKEMSFRESSAAPGDYDIAVDEAGSGTYNVADVFDGFVEIDGGRIIGYYNI